jgi:hypothetical protein
LCRPPLPRLDRGEIGLFQPHRAPGRHHAVAVTEQQPLGFEQRQPSLHVADRHRSASRQAFTDQIQSVKRRLALAKLAGCGRDRLRRGIGMRRQTTEPFGYERVAVARGQSHPTRHMSDHNAFDLVERHIVAAPVVELGRPRRRVIGYDRRALQRAAVLQIGGDPGCAERMVADPGRDPRRGRATPHHLIGAGLGQRGAAQPPRPAHDRAEQRPSGVPRQIAAVDIGMEIRLEIVVARHRVALAALLVELHPQPSVLDEHVLDPAGQRRADPREGVDHQRDQRAVAQANARRHVDRVEQRARLGRVEHRRLAGPRAMRRPAHRHRRVGGHDLAAHQPVEEATHRGEPLLDRRRRQVEPELLDPRGDVERLDLRKRAHPAHRAPAEEIAHRAHRRAGCGRCGSSRRRIPGSAAALGGRPRRSARVGRARAGEAGEKNGGGRGKAAHTSRPPPSILLSRRSCLAVRGIIVVLLHPDRHPAVSLASDKDIITRYPVLRGRLAALPAGKPRATIC